MNSLAHVFGRRRYDTGDESKNSFIIALFTLGEGNYSEADIKAAARAFTSACEASGSPQ